MGNINIEIPDELHKKAKKSALHKETTLKDYIIDAIKTKNILVGLK